MKYILVVPSLDGGMMIRTVDTDEELLKMITPDAEGYTYFGNNVYYMRASEVPTRFDENDMFAKHPDRGENMVILIIEVKRVVVPKPKTVVLSYDL